ncbi:MAG: AAA domain-containing protein [Luteimonas sp.]
MPNEAKDILRFWRDVEIFNIPSVPKRESKPNRKVVKYKTGAPLPWSSGHDDSLVPSEKADWVHAVFLGVAPHKDWSQVILRAACPTQQLTEGDLQQLGGDGWLAAFLVNGEGQVVPDSYVPVSFSAGVQRLLSRKSLDGLNSDIQEKVEAFKERRARATIIACDANVETNEANENPSQKSVCGQAPSPFPVGWAELEVELQHALACFGKETSNLPFSVVIKSTLRKRRKNSDAGKDESDIDFLNSFYLNDLDRLIGEADQARPLGKALDRYLGSASSNQTRQDILRQPDAMAACLSPAKLPLGRWPAKQEEPLMLAQQAAVNEISSQLYDSAGLVAVNGPPGTGKTTLLCDVVADVVVRRAGLLAKLRSPWEAFGNKTTIGGLNVFPFKPEIVAGTGIVVSSNNNTAVENITRELPALAKIADGEHVDAAYFQEVAAHVFAAAEIKAPAWGLVAAALGNADNRWKFSSAFFRDGTPKAYVPGTPCDIKTTLEAQGDDALGRWQQAKNEFVKLYNQAEAQRRLFVKTEDAIKELARLRRSVAKARMQVDALQFDLSSLPEKWARHLKDAQERLTSSENDLAAAELAEQQEKLAAQIAADRLQVAEATDAPRIWDRWLKAIGRMTERMHVWDEATSTLRRARANASEGWRKTLECLGTRRRSVEVQKAALAGITAHHAAECSNLAKEIESLQGKIKRVDLRCQKLERCVAELKETGATVPDAAFFKRPVADRHLSSVWVTPEFDLLRSQLFLAALRLHESTLLACKGKAIANLRAVKAMLARDTPEPIAESQRNALWDMLFFTVPVVSSTLASFDRLFTGLGREALGWLLIDEAGQATPQSVAGALWRSRRVVIIGDPKQVEPVLTVPSVVVAELRNKHGIDICWSPAKESAQTLADRGMALGAWIGDPRTPETAIWTGLPLRAHRRCIDPMFSVANAIAYDGQMVQANTNPKSIRCSLGESAWFDVQGNSNDGQIVCDELICLTQLLQQLKSDWPVTDDGKAAGVFVISPFRKVAEAGWEALRKAGINKKEWPVDCGTVHRFQGQEAEIVVILLGSAPGKAGSGSRHWASAKPNLLNVALTRAKLRVYVIGSALDWSPCQNFDVLLDDFRLRKRILKS